MPCLEPVETQRAVDGINQPDFADAGALINRDFDDLVMAGGTRREHLGDLVGRTAHAAHVEFLKIANNEDIGLHHRIDLVVLFGGLG